MTHSWASTPERSRRPFRRSSLSNSQRGLFRSVPPRGVLLIATAIDKESARIRQALGSVSMPMDILVISEKRLKELGDQPGLVCREALRTGKVVYDAAA